MQRCACRVTCEDSESGHKPALVLGSHTGAAAQRPSAATTKARICQRQSSSRRQQRVVLFVRQQDLLELTSAIDVGSLESGLVKVAQSLEFGLVSAALAVERPGREPLFRMIGNTPEAFLAASRDPGQVKRDPVLNRMRTSSLPFAYSRRTYVEAGADDLWEDQAQYGYKSGIAVALHLSAGKHFLLGVDRDLELPEEGVLMRLMADLHLLAAYAQDAAVRLLGEPGPADVPALTPREYEVLVWAAEGKTAAETGAILGVTGRAVEFHLHNAMAKFGAPNKHAAVARAVSLGLLKSR